jgi:hypothetical protein
MDNLWKTFPVIAGLHCVFGRHQVAKALADWERERGYTAHADERERRYRYLAPIFGLVMIGLGIQAFF